MQFEKNCDILNDALCRGVCGRVHNFFERICNMGVFDYIIGGLLLLMAIFLVVAIMLQSGKGKGLSGTIAGGSGDSYYGKNKGRTRDQMLSRLTAVVAIVFVVLVLFALYLSGQDRRYPKHVFDRRHFVANLFRGFLRCFRRRIGRGGVRIVRGIVR